MSRRTRHPRPTTTFHPLEPLEPRIQFSATVVPTPTQSSVLSTQSSPTRYRTAALAAQQAASQHGTSYSNPQYADAQDYFNLSHNSYTPYEPPAPTTEIPSPTTDPTAQDTPTQFSVPTTQS